MPAPLVLLGLAALGALLLSSSPPAEKPSGPTGGPLQGLGPNDAVRRDDGTLVATEAARSQALTSLAGYHLVAEPRAEGSVALHRLAPGLGADGMSARDAVLAMREQGFDTWVAPGSMRPDGLPALAFVAPNSGVIPLGWVLLFAATEELPLTLPPGFSPGDFFMLPGGVVKAQPEYARKMLLDLDRARLEPTPGLAQKLAIVQGVMDRSALAEVKAAHDAKKDVWFTADLLVQGPSNASNPALVFLAPADRPKAMIPGAFVLLLDASEPWPAGVDSLGAEFTKNAEGVLVPTQRAIVEARALLALWMQTTTSFSHGVAAAPSDFGSANRPLDLTSPDPDERMLLALSSFASWLDASPSTRGALGIGARPSSPSLPLDPWLLDALFRVGAAISDTLRGQPAGGQPRVSVIVDEGASPAITVRPNTIVDAIVKTKAYAGANVASGPIERITSGEDATKGELHERTHSFLARTTGSTTVEFVDTNGQKRATLAIIVRDEFGEYQPVAEEGSIVVKSGQSPAFLANYYTGDPARFVELKAANPGLGALVRKGSGVNFANWKTGIKLRLPSNWTKKPAPGVSR